MYVDGVVSRNEPTTQTLPSGHKLNGTQAYLRLLSFFTTLDISPRQLKDIAQKRLDNLLSQVGRIDLFSLGGLLPHYGPCDDSLENSCFQIFK